MPKRNETLKFSTSFLGSVRASAQTIIVDTSYPMTYNTRWSANTNGSGTITEINEGNDAYFIVSSDNVPDGTVLSIMLTSGPSANGISGDDIVNYQYKQNITIYNNFASLRVSIAADQVTENREEFYGALLDSNGTNLSYAWLSINDTSKTPAPTYSLMWTASATSNSPISSINEDSTAWLIVKTTNLPNGSALTATISGANVTTDDFADGIMSKVVLAQNNLARFSFSLKNDIKTEGPETITVTLTNGGTVVGTANLVINDTSMAAITEVYWASDYLGVNRKNAFTWGDEQFLIVKSDNSSGNVSLTFNTNLTNGELEVGSINPVSIPLSYNNSLNSGYGFYKLQTMLEDDVSFAKNRWYNKLAERVVGKTYTNDTDETIYVSVVVYHSENNTVYSTMSIDGIVWAREGGHMDDGFLRYRYTMKGPVRPGGSYIINSPFLIEVWSELRPSA